MRLSEKLGALFAAVALLPVMVASILVLIQISSTSRGRATDQLEMNARVAARLYDKRLEELRSATQKLADDVANRTLVRTDNAERDTDSAHARLQDMLARSQQELNLDFVLIADSSGKIIAGRPVATAVESSTNNLIRQVDKNPIVERVFAEGNQARNTPTAAAVVERGMWLTQLGLDQVARVDRADGTSVDEALVVEAGAPVMGAGEFLGMVLAGQMLNTFYKDRAGATTLQVPVVAEIGQALYKGDAKRGGALIALNDTIVASNLSVVADNGKNEPALKGMRRDPNRVDELMEHGNESFNVAWQPIKGIDGNALGAIGVAVPSGEFGGSVSSLGTTLFVIAAFSCLLAGAGGYLLGRSLGSRLTTVIEAANRMAVGELSTTVKDPAVSNNGGLVSSIWVKDEISRLAEQLDETRESFRLAIERLRKR